MINITEHASKRIKERLCIKSQKLKENVVSDTLTHGITTNNCITSGLKFLMEDLNKDGHNTIYYKEHIFLFKNDSLITVLPIEERITREYNKYMKKKMAV